jgi:hypothetical protein
MPSTVTVTATVQDPSGTALAGNCFVRFRLRNFAGYVPQISGTSIMPEIQIDATPTTGLVSQALWPNNAITPSTTFYTVELWNQGRITSSGNYIFNSNTSLNSAAQVNTPPVPAGFSLVLENNGALNSSQSTLNLQNGTNIVITDGGSGNLTIASTSSGSPSGSNVWPTSYAGFITTNPAAIVLAGHTWIQMFPGSLAYCMPASWKFTISSISGNTVKVAKAVVAITTAGSLTVNSFNPVTFNGGSTTATFTTTQTSDAIAIQIDADHDYYIMVYYDPTSGNPGYWQDNPLYVGTGDAAVNQVGDQTTTSPITTTSGSVGNLFQKIVVT